MGKSNQALLATSCIFEFFVELSYVEIDVGTNKRKFAGFHGLKITQSKIPQLMSFVV